MRTVSEVSKMTGISVRTLHYYDEINLLKPASVTDAGYRLYDDKALETLQQILFFREFDMPLGDIKAILETPSLSREQILRSQREILNLKRLRLERLLTAIDDMLKGDKQMNFEIFSKTEIETMYQQMVSGLMEEQKDELVSQYGSLEAFEEAFVTVAGTKAAQDNYKMMVKWYGAQGNEAENQEREVASEILGAYQKREAEIYGRLAAAYGSDVNSFAVKSIIGEMDFVSKQMYQMKDVKEMMLRLSVLYRENDEMIQYYDGTYGKGRSQFFADAIEAFYK